MSAGTVQGTLAERARLGHELEREPVHEHVGRLGELARTGLQDAPA